MRFNDAKVFDERVDDGREDVGVDFALVVAEDAVEEAAADGRQVAQDQRCLEVVAGGGQRFVDLSENRLESDKVEIKKNPKPMTCSNLNERICDRNR